MHHFYCKMANFDGHNLKIKRRGGSMYLYKIKLKNYIFLNRLGYTLGRLNLKSKDESRLLLTFIIAINTKSIDLIKYSNLYPFMSLVSHR